MTVRLGDHLDADPFRQGVSDDLGDHEGDLVVQREGPAFHPFESRRREWLAEGVHGEIGAEAGHTGKQGKTNWSRVF
ncbi:hypothetical protein D3C71_2110960 [compost metagenome]